MSMSHDRRSFAGHAPRHFLWQAEGKVADVVAIAGPTVGLPDTAGLLADAGTTWIFLGIALQ